MFGADTAVLMHGRVLLALFSARATGNGARLKRCYNHLFVAARTAGSEGTGSQAKIGAIEGEPDTLPKLSYHFLR